VLDERRAAYRTPVPLVPGLLASIDHVITDADMAHALGTGDVPVLATPQVVLLAERATVVAVEGNVPEEFTTVGYRVQLDHLAPVPLGDKVTADAILESIEGRRLVFRVSVKYHGGLVAAGRITRVVVERARFLEKAQAPT
jgi:predicted thioesterase